MNRSVPWKGSAMARVDCSIKRPLHEEGSQVQAVSTTGQRSGLTDVGPYTSRQPGMESRGPATDRLWTIESLFGRPICILNLEF